MPIEGTHLPTPDSWSLTTCPLRLNLPLPAAAFSLRDRRHDLFRHRLFNLNRLSAAAVADPKIDAMVAKAVDYLTQQSPDGDSLPSGRRRDRPGDHGLLRNGRSPDDPLVARSLKFLESSVQPDGGIYAPKLGYQNYETCIALTCFVDRQRRQALRQDHPQRREVSQGNAVDRGRERERPDEEDRQVQSVLRRRGIRPEQAARPFQHGLHDRCLEGGGQRPGRRGDEEGPGLRLPLPEPGERKQHDAQPRPRIPTAASTTRPPTAAKATPASCPTAACGATPR